MTSIKDFTWERSSQDRNNPGWREHWVPLGEGMVDWKYYFHELRRAEFHGPISLHIEYNPGGTTPSAKEGNLLAAPSATWNFYGKLCARPNPPGRAACSGAGIPACRFLLLSEKGGRQGCLPTIRVENISIDFEEFLYRAPYVFGGRAVDRATILNVHTTVRTRDGRTAHGYGSMPLGNQWSFPSDAMPYGTTLGAMRHLAEEIRKITADYMEYGHPLDLTRHWSRNICARRRKYRSGSLWRRPSPSCVRW